MKETTKKDRGNGAERKVGGNEKREKGGEETRKKSEKNRRRRDVSAHSIFRVFLFCLCANQTKVLPELAARYSPDQLETGCQMETSNE